MCKDHASRKGYDGNQSYGNYFRYGLITKLIHPCITKQLEMSGTRKRDEASTTDGYLDDEAGVEDEDFIEDEDYEEERGSKKKRTKNMFLDVEAAVDEEEEEEEFEDGQDEEFIDEQEIAEAEREYSRLLATQRPKPALEENFDPEAEAQRLKELYGRSATVSKFLEEVEHLPETLLAPSVSDAKLWLIKCRPGKEKDVIQSIWKRYRDREHADKPLQITSVISRDHLKGYLYIEAFKQTDVTAALEHIPHVFSSKPSLVPIEEMMSVLKIPPRQIPVKPDSWIRIKRGKYAGDLAQVIDIDEITEKATVRLVPRLESHLLTGGTKSSASRPEAKLFFPSELPSHLRRQVSRPIHSRRHWMYHGERFTTDGYLEKDMAWSGLDCEPSLQPSLEEIASFVGLNSNIHNQQIDEPDMGDRLSKLPPMTMESTCFFPDDLVRIIEGDLSQQLAKIISISGDNAIVLPRDPSMSFHVTIPIRSLRKEFRVGDHVRISGAGKYSGELGLIVSIQDDSQTMTIFLDSSKQQVTVLSRDIVSPDVEHSIVNTATKDTKKGSVTQFQLEDLIAINDQQHTIGIVLNHNIGSDILGILDQNCVIREIEASTCKLQSTRHSAIVYDAYSNQVCIGNKIQVLHGDHSQLQGIVAQIYRQSVFIRTPELYEFGGYLCVKNSNIGLVNERGDLCIPSNSNQSISMIRSRSARQQNDSILGSTVVICTGLYKGKMGNVRTSYDNSLEVDLHTGKRITVNRGDVQLSNELGYTSNIYAGANTPFDQYGDRTPGGFKTPYQDGSKTPWDTYGGRTPGIYGGKTPSWATPHHGGGKTPMIQGDYYQDNTGGGYTTPGYKEKSSTFVHPSRIAHVDIESRLRPNIEVSVNNVDQIANGTRAVVQSVDQSNDDVVISLIEKNTVLHVSMDRLSIVKPKRNDSVIIVTGDKAGVSGTVIGQDNTDLLIKPSSGDVIVVNMDTVAVLHKPIDG